MAKKLTKQERDKLVQKILEHQKKYGLPSRKK